MQHLEEQNRKTKLRSSPWHYVLPFLLILAFYVFLSGCSGGPLTTREKGAGIGVLGGAAVGGIVGHQSGHAGIGALIGGILGGLGGGLIGDQLQGREQQQNEQQQEIEQNQKELERQRQELNCLKKYGPEICRN